MLQIPAWRRVTILALVALGLLFAMPNSFYTRVERHNDAMAEIEALGETPERAAARDGWPGWLPSTIVSLGLDLRARGDVEIDLHHTVEDVGIVLGDALREALGNRAGVRRFAHAYAPLDEALARAVVDLSGRGSFHFRLPSELELAWVTTEFPLTLVGDFFGAFADRGRFTLHLDVVCGRNPHHVAEAAFKAVALALRRAVSYRVPGDDQVPSTKGSLTA